MSDPFAEEALLERYAGLLDRAWRDHLDSRHGADLPEAVVRAQQHVPLLLAPALAAIRHEASRPLGEREAREDIPLKALADVTSAHLAVFLAALDELEDAADRRALRQLLVRRFVDHLAEQAEAMLGARTQEYHEAQSILRGIDAILFSSASREELERRITEELTRVAGISGAWIGVPDESGRFVVRAASGEGIAEYLSAVDIRADDTPAGHGMAGRSWQTGQVIVSDDWYSDPLTAPWVRAGFGWRSSVAVPLRGARGRLSLLALYSRQPRFFSRGSRKLLVDHLSAVLGLALEHAELEAEDKARRAHISRLQGLYKAVFEKGEVLIRAQREHEIFYRTCERLVQSRVFCTAWIGRPDASGIARPLAASGLGGEELLKLDVRLDAKPPCLLALAWRKGQVRCENRLRAGQVAPEWAEVVRREGFGSAAVVPFRRGGSRHGLLTVFAHESGFFDQEALSFVASLGDLLTHALDEMDLKERLEEEKAVQSWRARHDPLTDLPNRIAFLEQLPAALARAERRRHWVAVGMMDLDQFKWVNDTYGHEMGDVLLREIARRLQQFVRQTDVIARFGGDEFALLFEGVTSAAQLEGVLTRLQHALEVPFDLPHGRRIEVRASVGITVYPFDAADPSTLLRHADQALYLTKGQKEARLAGDRNWAYFVEPPT